MNKTKISAQDIIDAIVQRADITKSLSEDFFKAFITSIEEGLQANGSVKIKDFGVFKLNWIASRKSVNIQTGEDVVIDGYNKVIFMSGKKLREQVNQPFVHLEPVVLGEENTAEKEREELNPLAALSEQADEIKGLLSEIQSMSAASGTDKIMKPDERPAEKETAKPIPAKVNEQVFVNVQKKKRKTLPCILLIVFLLLGLAAAAYFFCMPVQHWVNKAVFGHDTAAYDAARKRASLLEERLNEKEQTTEEQPVVVDGFQEAFDRRFDNRKYITTEKLNYGSRLAHLAVLYYGSPYFWVYIYEANMETIPDPDHVQEGAVVRIPEMDSLLIDVNNSRSLEAALSLRGKYLK